jgi:hypothetical protein
VREAPTASVLTRSRSTESHRNRRPVCWQCGGTSHLRKECSHRTAKGVVDKRDSRRDCATQGLRAPTVELEAALERKAGGQRRVTFRTVRAVAAAPQDCRDRAALRRQHLASDRVKARQNRLTNSAGFNEGDRVWLYRPTPNRGKSPKHHSDKRRGLAGRAAP